MSKTVLRIAEDDKFDFMLIGIVCQHRDYRLCREINIRFGLKLSRQDDYVVFNNKRMEDQSFSFFQYVTDDEDQFNLINNRSGKGMLIPEQRQIDFLLLIRPGRMRIDFQQTIQTLKQSPFVLGAYPLEVKQLKSRENLVF